MFVLPERAREKKRTCHSAFIKDARTTANIIELVKKKEKRKKEA